VSQVAATKAQQPAIPAETGSIRDQLHATTLALVAAEEAQQEHGVGSVNWERRGLLGRLRRLG